MALQNFSAETAAYVDEEDCLGFKIWVAELELIIGSSRGKKKADAVQSFLLLQKLVVTLDRTDRLEIREYQRRCEDALIDILLKGAPPPVRTRLQMYIKTSSVKKKESFPRHYSSSFLSTVTHRSVA